MKKKQYDEEKHLLQLELLKLQRWVKLTGQRVIVLFEGRDAAGKGGTIKRFMEYLNPRGCRIVALEKPDSDEQSQWYFQRYVAHLPSAGEIVLFDRSWYNRAGVERVMGFCTKQQYKDFLHHTPHFEAMLVTEGIKLFKLWFSVSKEEQGRRFESRRKDPKKNWKLSPIDEIAHRKFEQYSEARNVMFNATHTPHAPWVCIDANDKRQARLACMRYVLFHLDYEGKDQALVSLPSTDILSAPGPDNPIVH